MSKRKYFREKYVEEKFGRYFIFGEHPDGIHVDVSGPNCDDIVSKVTKEQAEKIIDERDKVIDMLAKLADELYRQNENAFDKIWYKEEITPPHDTGESEEI